MKLTPYQAGDMVYTDYLAVKEDPDKGAWSPDESFNMLERGQMLEFINAFARLNQWEGDQLSSYRLLERVLREKLPSDIRSQKNAVEWVRTTHGRAFKITQ